VPLVRWRDRDGTPREARTDRPGELVAAITRDLGGEPDRLEVIRPSLEDIYLDLVGVAEAIALDDEEALA
jgi:ABC-2 type transport system ATP-binding protein